MIHGFSFEDKKTGTLNFQFDSKQEHEIIT